MDFSTKLYYNHYEDLSERDREKHRIFSLIRPD